MKTEEIIPVQQNNVTFLRAALLDSGKTQRAFSNNAGLNENTLHNAVRSGDIQLNTAMRFLAGNGYVLVLQYTFREPRRYLITEDPRKDPFDVDWNTYRQTAFIRNEFRLDPSIMQKAMEELHLSDRAIVMIFEKDNAKLSKIFKLADCAGLDVKVLIKKDEEAAKIQMQRLLAKSKSKKK